MYILLIYGGSSAAPACLQEIAASIREMKDSMSHIIIRNDNNDSSSSSSSSNYTISNDINDNNNVVKYEYLVILKHISYR